MTWTPNLLTLLILEVRVRYRARRSRSSYFSEGSDSLKGGVTELLILGEIRGTCKGFLRDRDTDFRRNKGMKSGFLR